MSLVLANCAVVDAVADEPLRDGAVWIDRGTIAAVGPADDVVAAAEATGPFEVLDLDGAHILPGLVNMHVHFGLILPGKELERLRDESLGALALRMAANARATLAAGVTTVRLVAERGGIDIALRESIRQGETVGPRIFTAGAILISTGGHGHDLPGAVEADGPNEFRKAARAQLKAGADLVKISASGGIASAGEAIADRQLEPDEIRAVTQVAHSRGKRVAVHAGPPDVIADAVEAGVDSVEHGYFLTPQVAELMVDRGTWLVPTVNVSRAVAFFEKIGAPDWFVAKALEAGEKHWAALQAAIRASVPIALGTDMMPFEPFDGTTVTVRELEFMVEAGMTPLAAIRAATIRAAKLLGAQAAIGSLEVGKSADIIAVRGNPLADVTALRSLEVVVGRGAIVRAPSKEGARA